MNLSDYIPPAQDTWGPSKVEHRFTYIPVEFVGRTEKLGRFCDFTTGSLRTRRGDDEEEFKFVDSGTGAAYRQKKFAPRTTQWAARGAQQGGRYGQARGAGGRFGPPVRIDQRTGKPVVTKQQGYGASTGAKFARTPYQRGGVGATSSIVKGIREWSTPVKPEYQLLSEMNLASIGRKKIDLTKQEWFISDSSKIEYEDLITCGKVAFYEKSFDKTISRQPKPLVRADNINFYNVTTGQDPVMEELITRAVEAAAGEDSSKSAFLVACTDQVLSTLMAANRSLYSWDLVITRNGSTILIDKRDASFVDFCSVNENAQEQPIYDENLDPMTQINSPIKLGVEATSINQNFSQQVLDATHVEEMEYPNPFQEEEEEGQAAQQKASNAPQPAMVAYTYRKAFIPSNINSANKEWNFIIRGEINAKTFDPSDPTLTKNVSVKALTEYDPKITNWRDNFDKSRDAAVMAVEMKNNAGKIAKWLASAVVSGCDLLKLGFVSRKLESDPWNHSILSVQTHNVKDLLQQMSLSQQTMWSTVCSILDQIVSLPNEPPVGRYLLMKDPSKAAVNIYSIPWDEFEEEEQYDEEEADGGDNDEEFE